MLSDRHGWLDHGPRKFEVLIISREGGIRVNNYVQQRNTDGMKPLDKYDVVTSSSAAHAAML
jgi:phosphopantetheine adenylyltransferase